MPDHDPTHESLHDELNLILANPGLRGARLVEAVGGALAGRCADPYRTVLQCAASIDLPETQARGALTAIEQQRAEMETRLGRDPGFPVALLSWLLDVEERLVDAGFRDAERQGPVASERIEPAALALDPPEEDEARRGERYDRPLACVALAPDVVAPQEGAALVSAAARVREAARDVDHTRTTAHDIRLVLPCTAGEGALIAAERWRRMLRGATGLEWSAGVASSPRPVSDPQAVAGLALEALRTARRAGGDRTSAYRPEKRAHERRPVAPWLAGELRLDDRDTPAVIEDLSLGGALLETAEVLPAGSEVLVTVRDTSARPRTVVVSSRVQRCAPRPEGTAGPWRMAVAFRAEGEARRRLAGLIADLPRARGTPPPEAR